MTSALKKRAALKALEFIHDGMRIGLGTGSTAAFFIEALGEKVRAGLDIQGVPTSETTAATAREQGVPLMELEEATELDLTVDGADEVTSDGAMIKGGGAALLREKIVAHGAKRFLLIADGSKRVRTLGAFPLPVEVIPFGAGATIREIRQVLADQGFEAAPLQLRPAKEGGGFVATDNGNLVCDLRLQRIEDPAALDRALTMIPGVVTTGLFLGLDVTQLLATEDGFLDV